MQASKVEHYRIIAEGEVDAVWREVPDFRESYEVAEGLYRRNVPAYDEKVVRESAFAAIRKSVDDGRLSLERQLFFNTRSFFESFDQFDQRMIQVTHTSHQLAPELYRRVKDKFESYLTPEGATFLNPQRVDLLRKVR